MLTADQIGRLKRALGDVLMVQGEVGSIRIEVSAEQYAAPSIRVHADTHPSNAECFEFPDSTHYEWSLDGVDYVHVVLTGDPSA